MNEILENYKFDLARLENVFTDRDRYYSFLRDRAEGVVILEFYYSGMVGYCVYFWLSADDLLLMKEDRPAYDKLLTELESGYGSAFSTRLLYDPRQGSTSIYYTKPRRAFVPME